MWSRRRDHHHGHCACQPSCHGDTSSRDLFSSSNCAFDNKRERNQCHQKRESIHKQKSLAWGAFTLCPETNRLVMGRYVHCGGTSFLNPSCQELRPKTCRQDTPGTVLHPDPGPFSRKPECGLRSNPASSIEDTPISGPKLHQTRRTS